MKLAIVAFSVAALAGLAQPALAATEFVTNGSFSASSYTTNSEFSDQFGGQGVTGWTSTGYNLYFIAGTQSTVSAANRYNDPLTYLYPNVTTSPDGGNFIALDGDTNIHGPVSQTLSGLSAGQTYAVSFDWAAAQLANRSGDTTEQLVVGFGNQTHATAVVPNTSHGFTGWMKETFYFTASGSTQVLSFLSDGTPNGLPPIALLDGVSVKAVPEPATIATLGLGIVALGGIAVRRRARA